MKETAYQGRYFSIQINTNDVEVVYTGNEVLVVPVTGQEDVILTLEPSDAFEELTLILPGGEVEPGELFGGSNQCPVALNPCLKLIEWPWLMKLPIEPENCGLPSAKSVLKKRVISHFNRIVNF